MKVYETARVRFILNNNHEVETVVKNFRYTLNEARYQWDEHPAYPVFIEVKHCVLAIVILEVLDQQPCTD